MNNILYKIYRSLSFRLIKIFVVTKYRAKGNEKVIYLTFDDGPEPGITEAILDLLDKYQAKATFFNKGENCKKYPEILEEIVRRGHSIGNHTYSHINGLSVSSDKYLADIARCSEFCHSSLLRPAYGAITIKEYWKLRKRYKIVLWNKVSGDHLNQIDNCCAHIKCLQDITKSGDIILFHDCKMHEKLTLKILPEYLDYLKINNFEMKIIT
jgi:peptidoglycan/xylan/chitin deacetylase (PgdA/CDA1 family)